MRVINKEESIRWLGEKGLVDSRGRVNESAFAKKRVYHIPEDSGRKTFIARCMADAVKAFDESLVWIDEWGVWPSAENQPLFYAFRRSFGETRLLIKAPGHVTTPADYDAVFSLLSMVLYFVWDVIVAPSSGDFLIEVSHDEWADIYLNRDVALGPTLDSAVLALANEYSPWEEEERSEQ